LCNFRHAGKTDIFGGEPLGIFKVPESQMQTVSDEQPEITTWHRLEARELRLVVTHPPSNIFEEMIQWTEQGKLWHLPINNEQGLNRINMMSYFTCLNMSSAPGLTCLTYKRRNFLDTVKEFTYRSLTRTHVF
jgi:hypothetical protein